VRRPAHVADAALRVAAAEADEAREESREGAGARQPVVVHTQTEITVRTGRIRREEAAVNVPHGLRIFRGGISMAVLLALPCAIAERRRQPEVAGCPGRRTRARQRHAEQRVDARQREVGGVAGRCPPDVCARLKDDRCRIARRARGQSREIRGGPLEVAAIERIEAGPQSLHAIGRPKRALQDQHNRGEHRHLSAARR